MFRIKDKTGCYCSNFKPLQAVKDKKWKIKSFPFNAGLKRIRKATNDSAD
ncbi:hypothetical protein Fmac_014930 [Flemingia macrophylla]|uniref:Uncharacterized protein n=1 Tax=Flemingia macrophylla TaxID=520843 RepID=A0ABD1MD43_9FABA